MIWGVGETKTKNNNRFKIYVEGISLQEHPCDILYTRIMSACVYSVELCYKYNSSGRHF